MEGTEYLQLIKCSPATEFVRFIQIVLRVLPHHVPVLGRRKQEHVVNKQGHDLVK